MSSLAKHIIMTDKVSCSSECKCWCKTFTRSDGIICEALSIRYYGCVCVLALVIRSADHICCAPNSCKWPVWLYNIFPNYFERHGQEKSYECNVFWFPVQLLSEAFVILRRIQRDSFVNLETSLCKVAVILVKFEWNLNFLGIFSTTIQTSNFMKIRWVGAELYADRHMSKPVVAFGSFGN